MTHTHKQSLTIRDLGSTHGTYIGNLKLEKDKRHPLNSGDVVTFGTKVTSGTCKSCLDAFCVSRVSQLSPSQATYFAQHFRVTYSLKDSECVNVDRDRSQQGRMALFSDATNSVAADCDGDRSVGFHLPSEDSESDDDQSRENSFEPSPPSFRANYDTPSTSPLSAPNPDRSGSVDLEIISPTGRMGAENAIGGRHVGLWRPNPSPEVICIHESEYTRAAAKNTQVDVYGLEWADLPRSHKADPGSSQAHPIDLDNAERKAQYAVVSDSEDDGPEALPISQYPAKSNQGRSDAGLSKATPVVIVEPIEDSDMSDREASIDLDAPAAAESTIAENLSESGDSNSADEEQTNYGSDSDMRDEDGDSETSSHRYNSWDTDLNEEDDDEDDEDENEDEDMSALSYQNKITTFSLARDSPKPRTAQDQVPVNNDLPSESSRILVEDSQALSRPDVVAKVTTITRDGLEARTIPSFRKTMGRPPLRAPSPSDAALAKSPNPPTVTPAPAALSRILCEANAKDRMATILPTAKVTVSGSPYAESVPFTTPNANFNPYAMNLGSDFNQAASKPTSADAVYFGHQSPSAYEDGPFAWPQRTFHSPDQVGYTQPTAPYPMSSPSQMQYLDPQNPWAEAQVYGMPPFYPPVNYSYDQPREYAEFSRDSKKPAPKSSKLPISDIVNDATPLTDLNNRISSLKRKLDGISSDEHTLTPLPVSSNQPSIIPIPTSKPQETPLLDAQPGEDILPVESPPTEPSSVPTKPPPANESSRAVDYAPDASQDLEEPARKRVKTTSKRVPSLRSFVSGVIAGGVSVVGALLVYGATAPEALQEVVRKEFEGHV